MFLKHDFLKIPRDIKKEFAIVSMLNIAISIAFDLFSFFLEFGKNQIVTGNIILGLVLIGIYYIRSTINSSITLWMNDIHQTCKEHFIKKINNKVVKILLNARGKVWRLNQATLSKEILPTNSVLLISKNYIYLIWEFQLNIPRKVFDIISTICVFVGFIFVTNLEVEHTLLFISIIVCISIFSIIFSIERIKTKNLFIKNKKEYHEKQDIALNDILNIEPLNNQHGKYMADNFIKNSEKIFSFEKQEQKNINKINFKENFMASLATITIIVVKVWETKIENVDLSSILSIISLLSIYSQIMNKINYLIHLVEDGKGTLEEIKNYQMDFNEILKIIDTENSDNADTSSTFGKVKTIHVPQFSVQYQQFGTEKPFSLKNEKNEILEPGDIILLTGPTGSGKSTFMKMLTNKINFENFELYYERTVNGPIHSVMHQTDGKLGSNSILSELTFDDKVDSKKLLHILKGLHLYEEISKKNKDVLKHLSSSKIEDYSSGQKQRFAIARLLYNLDESVQIIGFDEATNALNDAITLQTLNFIKEYCTDKILLIATHQIDIGEDIATRKLNFVPSGTCYKII